MKKIGMILGGGVLLVIAGSPKNSICTVPIMGWSAP